MQVVGRILPAMYYKSIKSQGSRMGTTLLLILVSLSRRGVDFHVATSILHASVTSRRGPPTSRRQFSPSLSRRDVDIHVAT